MPKDTPDPTTQHIQFTQFETSNRSKLTKGFDVGPDGSIVKTSHAQLSRGVARRLTIDSIFDLPEVLDALQPNQCIATGVFDAPEVEVIARDAEHPVDNLLPVKNRTKGDMQQPEPGMCLFDHDPSPRMPEPMRCSSATDLWERLVHAAPALKGVCWVGRGSSSQGVFNNQTGDRYSGSGGIHVYIGLNTCDLVIFRGYLEWSLWQAGLGYIELASNGRRLCRTIIDLTVLSPERLIFEAPPILGLGIGREAPAWEGSHG